MLRDLKLWLLKAAAPMSAFLLRSDWRRQKLLILCYHGVSLADEHCAMPYLYMPLPQFTRRLQRLRELGAQVLPLGEAVDRLYSGKLPARAVTITFDDGFYDFYALAWPLLREHSWPVTLYLTTYYSGRPWPVFDPTCHYLLWKAQGRRLEWKGVFEGVLDKPTSRMAHRAILEYAIRSALNAEQKNTLLCELAERLGVSIEPIMSKRLFHIMKPEEVQRVAAEGACVEMHTHIHRVFRRKERLLQEIDKNREAITAMTGKPPQHFCYPGGFFLPEFGGWLQDHGIASATTCETGMATALSHRMMLPRLLDGTTLMETEFDAWVSGLSQLLPRRSYAPDTMQLAEEPE